MYSLMNVNIFTELCNYPPPNFILEYVHYPKKQTNKNLVPYVLSPHSQT